MKNENPITVSVNVNAPIETVWECWTAPDHITEWAFASDDWETPAAENDLRVGGKSKTTMAAKDKSASFDLVCTYTAVDKPELLEYDMADGRHVKIVFSQEGNLVKITQTFDPEQENSEELQREGWQAILENFKKHVEAAH